MELLAPVGNSENLIAAVAAGANAVYLGLDALNARAKAGNFNVETLKTAVEYAHLHGVKVHVTLNVLLKNSEINLAINCLKAIENSGADAIIIADIGVLELAKIYAPSVQYHASTQMGIHNKEGARFLKRLGFDRIVLARETKADDIIDIKSNVDIELEYFVHGALCVSFSGNCYMSALAGGNSGNRGQCLQFCRKKYINSLDGKENYALSLKDNCMTERLNELKSLGIDSLKIEGRMKSKNYVYSVTSAYRKLLDGNKIDENDRYAMSVAFNRGGFTEGYIFGDDKNLIYPNIQNNIGYRACKILSSEKSCREWLLTVDDNSMLKDGQGIKIIENDNEIGGFKLKLRDGKILSNMPYNGYVHITSDDSLDSEIVVKKIPFDLKFYAKLGEKAYIIAKYKNIELSVTSDFTVEKAISAPNKKEELIRQLSKFGDTDFMPSIELCVDDSVYIPNSVIAKLRRELVDELKEEILSRYKHDKKITRDEQKACLISREIKHNIIEINYDTIKLISDISLLDDAEIVLKLEDYSRIRQRLAISRIIYLKLPVFASKNTIMLIKSQIQKMMRNNENIGIFASNYYALEIAREYNLPVMVGFNMNLANDYAVNCLGAKNYCSSIELNKDESLKNGIIYSYGKYPVMTLLHCPYKNIHKCDCKTCDYKNFKYISSKGEFLVDRERNTECVFTVYNTVCHNLLNEGIVRKYIDLTTSKYTNEVLIAITNNTQYLEENTTKGMYFRKVK